MGEKGKTLHTLPDSKIQADKPIYADYTTKGEKILTEGEAEEIKAEIERWYGLLDMVYIAGKQN